MNKEKLVVVIMGQNCKKFIPMCYESVKDADAIVFCDGGSNDGTIDYLKDQGFEWEPVKENNKTMIFQHYDQIQTEMNGRQRNFYLGNIKKKYPGYWCLCVDADEVLEDKGLKTIKEFINLLPKENDDILFSPKMRHLIGDLGHEDSTQPQHFVPHRLFKIREDLVYPEIEHPVLGHKGEIRMQNLTLATIWHLAYAPNMWDIKKRYECHLAKSDMHTPKYLNDWYKAHLFGMYPNTSINPMDLPSAVLDEFNIDKDEIYFHNRNKMEPKHYQDAIDWKTFFKCKNAILFGCGFGQRVKVLNDIGIDCIGVEKSKYVVKNTIDSVLLGDIVNYESETAYDLAVAYDVLEHLKYKQLDYAITTLKNHSKKHILVSVPFIGSKDLDADPTHIIKEDKDWWVRQFTDRGLKLIKTPDTFLWKNQVMIFKKADKKKSTISVTSVNQKGGITAGVVE